MSIKLIKPVACYFTADKGDAEAIASCFAQHAVVKDEGHTYTGLAAIKQWKMSASTKYTYTSVPIATEEKDGKTIVTSRVSGNFPGSPVDLRYFSEVEGDKISSLEITQ